MKLKQPTNQILDKDNYVLLFVNVKDMNLYLPLQL